MSKKLLMAIRAQEKTREMFKRPSTRPNSQFKRQLSDDVIRKVLHLHQLGMKKRNIAAEVQLNESSIYNIFHRYLVGADGEVMKKRDPYEY